MNNATLLADWVRKVRELARRAGRNDMLELLDVEVAGFRRDAIHVVVAGGANTGKSARINMLLGRSVLPVSAMPSSASVVIRHGAEEAAASSEGEITLAHDWLHTTGIYLFERLPLDASDDETDGVIRAVLRGADVMILIVDALMPVTRVDAVLLAECARRGLPVAIVVSKCDLLSADERAAVLEYVQQHLERIGLHSSLLATDLTTDGSELRAVVESILASADLEGIRVRQVQEALGALMANLELAAHRGVEAQALTEAERAAEIRRQEQKLEAQSLVWTQIEQQLTVRRQKVDETVREQLNTHRVSILERWAFDLEHTGDVHRWWTSDLPYRLRQDLRAVSLQISNAIGRQVAGDIRWLHEELHRRFKLPVAAALAEPTIELDEVEVVPPDVPLADMQKFRIVSRVGAAATVVLASIALAYSGVAVATIAISSMVGLAADQIAQRVAVRDRGAVRVELDRVLQRAWLDLAEQAVARLKSGYDGVVAALKREQERWLDSQALALRNTAPAAAPVDWRDVLEAARALTADIAPKGDAA
jgi:GTPase Era involved in 16S rRNA processing